jgi:protein-tyrosine kinase
MLEHVQHILREDKRMLSEIVSNLASPGKDGHIKTIFVTSCRNQEGKSTSAVLIATALATQNNAKVLLIEGNFSSPSLYNHYQTPVAPGLFDFLNGSKPVEEFIKKTEHGNLFFMPLGTAKAKGQEFSALKDIRQRLGDIKDKFDFVIYDGPSAFGNSDPCNLAKSFDGVLIVLECGKTRWEVLQSVKEKMLNMNVNILGVILNKRKYYIPDFLYNLV